MDNAHPDPVTARCQNNNILIITEAESTADLNTTISTFADGAALHDGDTEVSSCGTLDGSTLLDDLTHYGWRGTDIFGVASTNQNIMTHIVIAGTPRAALRTPAAAPTALNEAGRFLLTANSFVSDLITVDYEIPQPNLPIRMSKSGKTKWDEVIK